MLWKFSSSKWMSLKYLLAENGLKSQVLLFFEIELVDKIYKMSFLFFFIWAATWQNQQSECAPSEDSDQPGHPPSLIRVFAVHMKKAWVFSHSLSAQRRLLSDWADAQADLSLRWAQTHFLGFVMSRLIYVFSILQQVREMRQKLNNAAIALC